ncbi:MAG: uroporphyrinogen decarboxylase family protein [Dehalococcoidia bacterium]|nr:uroporphyrinogen decarboxylase family protein [Dehalococcoidia bacterium]
MMTDRERVLAIMEGRSPDRIPWIPRLLIWHRAHRLNGTLPSQFKDMDLRQTEEALGMGNPAREGKIYRIEYRNMDVNVHSERYDGGVRTVTDYVTPKGTVRYTTRTSDEFAGLGIEGSIREECPLKVAEDYDIWEYVVENSVYVPTYEEYEAYDREIGDEGLPMVASGDAPFHAWLIDLVGYEHAYLHMHDFPERVERLLDLMSRKEKQELWELVAKSPAKLILHGRHFDSQITPAHYFEKYITPYYKEFSQVLHDNDKTLTFHADNDSSKLFPLIKESGFDMVDCFATAPLAKCTLKDAREAWGTSVIIWGGVPSVILEDWYPEEDFESYMEDLFRTIAPGDAFIMGVSDNVMPGAEVSRLERIAEMVEEHGHYPIRK